VVDLEREFVVFAFEGADRPADAAGALPGAEEVGGGGCGGVEPEQVLVVEGGGAGGDADGLVGHGETAVVGADLQQGDAVEVGVAVAGDCVGCGVLPAGFGGG
jgi:hypothetical protein